MSTTAFEARDEVVEKSSEAAARASEAWKKDDVTGRRENMARLKSKLYRALRQQFAGPGICDFVPLRMTRNGWLATGFVMAGSCGSVDIPKRGSKAGGKHVRAVCDIAKCRQFDSRTWMNVLMMPPADKFAKG